jgi:predicted phage terminase large subunit-like protein
MDDLGPRVRRALADEAARRSLPHFVERFFPLVAPDAQFESSWYIGFLCHEIVLAFSGANRRLIASLCPRSGKSVIISVLAVAWWLGHYPKTQFVCASYGLGLGGKLARDCRRVMQHPAYRRMFPAAALDPTKQAEQEFLTTAGGGRFTTSPGAGLTGRGGRILIFDDLMDAGDGFSQTSRDAAMEWIDRVARTRLDNPAKGTMVIVGQRLHQDDPIGRILEKEADQWRYLAIPVIAEEDEHYDLGNGRFHHRKTGDLLIPSRLPLDELERMKASMGSLVFNAQYMQRPVAEHGNIVRREWLRFYQGPYRSRPGDRIIQSWDCAMKTGPNNDYSVCITAAVNGPWDTGTITIIDVFRDRLEYPDLKRKIVQLHDQYRPHALVIEDAASGISVVQDIRQSTNVWPEAMRPVGDKAERLALQSAKIEQRRLWLPLGDPACEIMADEVVGFPGTRHDDQVDALVQLLAYLDVLDRRTVRQTQC